MENSVYALLRTRDMAVSRYREFGIPTNWLLDSGVVGKVCLKREDINFDVCIHGISYENVCVLYLLAHRITFSSTVAYLTGYILFIC